VSGNVAGFGARRDPRLATLVALALVTLAKL
jgi:hypothetical protein